MIINIDDIIDFVNAELLLVLSKITSLSGGKAAFLNDTLVKCL